MLGNVSADQSSTQAVLEKLSSEAMRSLGPSDPNLLQLNQTFYGCHCRNFNKPVITSGVQVATRGPNVDRVDQACAYLHTGWSCLVQRVSKYNNV